MPLFARLSTDAQIPLLNSASPWASTKEDLEQLWNCPFSEAITTRTSTLAGYPDDPNKHQVSYETIALVSKLIGAENVRLERSLSSDRNHR